MSKLTRLISILFVLLPFHAQLSAAPAPLAKTCSVNPGGKTRSVAGTISDPSGSPILSAAVSIACGSVQRQTHTAADGSYVLSVPEGAYNLHVDVPGFDPYIQPVTVGAAPSSNRNITLTLAPSSSTMTVVAGPGYVAINNRTGTKTDTPLLETPQSISVITDEQLRDRNVQSLTEALRYTSGVSTETYGADTRLDWFTIRGFSENAFGVYRDGLRSPTANGRPDLYGIQEVDVIKGPSSVLFGQNAPGGLVNMITKQPTAEQLHEVQLQFGSFSSKQVQADFSGPLDSLGHWRYRATGLYRNSDTQVDYTPDNRVFVAPALTWAPTEKMTLTFLTDFQHERTRWTQFLPASGTFLANPNGVIPLSLFTSDPSYDFVRQNQYDAGYLFVYRPNSIWTLHQSYRHSIANYRGQTAFGLGLAEDLQTLNRASYSVSFPSNVDATDNQAEAHFKTGAIQHTTLVGYDFLHTFTGSQVSFGNAPTLNVFRPVYSQTITNIAPTSSVDQPVSQNGLYFQDQIKLSNWTGILSGREDWAKSTNRDRLTSSTSVQNDSRFTGRAGLVYTSKWGLAPYGSYSTSFLPTIGVNLYGVPYKPTTGQQAEAGLKYQPKSWNGFVTASFFNLTQQNVQTVDPANTANSIQIGEVRNRGFELEAVAGLAYGLNLHAAYAHNNIKITQTTVPDQLGKHPVVVPDETASAILDYSLQRGRFTGLGGGFGVRYTGTQAGTLDNSLFVPGYTLYDANLHFLWRFTRFAVNASNVAGTRYVASCSSATACYYGYARNVIGSARFSW